MMFLAGAVNGYSMQSLSMGGAVRVSRAAMSKLAAPRMDITVEKSGEFGTTDFTMYFKKDGNTISPWHEIPLEAGDGMYNFVCEIPKMTLKKMEVATKVEGNPIMQDEKKGKARLYHGPIFWNYGCLPQTWEDPNVKGDADVGGAFGDDDPIDVVEIGAVAQEMGGVVPVKPLGVLSMIDDGELDWKVIAIAATDEHVNDINDVGDIEKYYPGTVSGIREWFRWYKTPDDKPINGFGHNEEALNAAKAVEVIKETNEHYLALMAGKTDAGKLSLK
jgi:inorganic pyrophosphatase